jgi:hypothetical protein
MARGSPSPTDQALIEALRTSGFEVSYAQLERWRSFGILPSHPREYLGRGKGSVSTLDPTIQRVAAEIAARVAATRPLQEVTLQLFLECPGLELTEKPVKASLEWFIDRKIRSAYRKVTESLAGVSATGEGAEDIAAQRIIDHYKGLKKPVRDRLYESFPDLPELALASTVGIGAIGSQRFLEIIDGLDPSGTESVAEAFRSAARDERGEELDSRPPGLSDFVLPEHQKDAIRNHSFAEVVDARDLLIEVAGRVRLLNMLREVLPDESVLQNMAETFEESFILRVILLMYPAEAGPVLRWGPDTKNLIALLTLEQGRQLYAGARDLLKLLDPYWADLLALARSAVRDVRA